MRQGAGVLIIAVIGAGVACSPSRGSFALDGGNAAVLEDGALAIATLAVPPAELGVSYRVPLLAQGGTGYLTWSLLAPSAQLSDWLVLSPDGVLSSAGLPDQTIPPPGAPFTIRVEDGQRHASQRVFTLAVSCTSTAPLPCGVRAASACMQGFQRCVNGQSTACSLTAGSAGTTDLEQCDPSCAPCRTKGNQCENGRCVCGATGAGCPPGGECCPGDAGVLSASCPNLMTDPAHCGGCQSCMDPVFVQGRQNVAGVCNGGQCSYVCAAGYQSCAPGAGPDGGPGPLGCPTNLGGDTGNCGACGNLCNPLNASAAACDGHCQFQCNAGYADCDGDGANGCEKNLLAAFDSCGTCGHACSSFEATATCNAGHCQLLSCAKGWDDCDHDPDNGCEASLATTADCGACGQRCYGAAICQDGRCCVPGKTC